MSAEHSDVEALLRSALVPVEPSERMTDRLERSLSDITDIAAGELADWELSAMRDPRNWGRPRRWSSGAWPPAGWCSSERVRRAAATGRACARWSAACARSRATSRSASITEVGGSRPRAPADAWPVAGGPAGRPH